MKHKVDLKNEILYLVLIIIVTIYFSYSTHIPNNMYILSGVLGNLLILTWFIRAFALYSGRKISQYSEVIQRISLKERFFTCFVLPIIFYTSLLLFVYFNTQFVMDIVLIIMASILLLILFLNVKSSFKKIYSIEKQTRAIFDFICIASFYMILSVVVRLGQSMLISLPIIFFTSLIFFWSDIKIHRKEGLSSFVLTVLSSVFVAIICGIFFETNIFVIPAVGTLAFYLILSIWNIRFAGKIKFADYLAPFIYSMLALILILKL